MQKSTQCERKKDLPKFGILDVGVQGKGEEENTHEDDSRGITFTLTLVVSAEESIIYTETMY